jgi:hypothetical protein
MNDVRTAGEYENLSARTCIVRLLPQFINIIEFVLNYRTSEFCSFTPRDVILLVD